MTRADLRWAVALLAMSPFIASCGDSGADAPALTHVSPPQGTARGGETITLEGHGFGSSPVVRFGGEAATVQSATDTRIEVLSPRAVAGIVDVEVTSKGEVAALEHAFTYVPAPLAFVDVAWAKVPPLAVDGGLAVIVDADGDGDGDVLQAARREGVFLYENDGHGRLSDPVLLGLDDDAVDVRQVVAADFDGDGLVDLFLATTGGTPSRVLFGQGELDFTSSVAALPPLFGDGQTALAVDLDGDDHLDLVTVGSATAADAPSGVALLSNDGAGRFTDVTAERLAGAAFDASGVVAGDFDGDGAVDLFFAAGDAPCRLHLGDGHGALKLAAPDAIPTTAYASPVGIPAAADLDGDGDLDLFLPAKGQDRVLVNDGKGRFVDVTDVTLGPESGASESAALADLDLDGHVDAVVVEPNGLRLYRNDGTGRLFDYSAELAGHASSLLDRGLAVGDLDGDGGLDLFVSRGGFSRAALFASAPLTPADDGDEDGFPDDVDNCPATANPDQANLDSLPFQCDSAASCEAATGCDLRVFRGSTYLVCASASATWADAGAACAARGGSLVSIADGEENAALLALGVADAWIGHSDSAVEGTWVATQEGSTSHYTNWAMNQPDDAGGDEDCAVFLEDGTWNDAPCSGARGYVCEDVRSKAPDPGDACDACPSAYEPGSAPVSADAGTCDDADAGAP